MDSENGRVIGAQELAYFWLLTQLSRYGKIAKLNGDYLRLDEANE